MKARLRCETGIKAGTRYDISQQVTIGKSAKNDIPIEDNVVSNRHARIYFEKNLNAYVLEDLDSKNGTKLDGVRVTQKEKLGPLHIVTFAGRFDFIFQLLEGGVAGAEVRASQSPAGRESGKTIPEQSSPTSKPSERTIFGDEAAVVPPKLSEREKARSRPLPGADGQKTLIGDQPVAPPKLSEREKFRARPVPPPYESMDAGRSPLPGEDTQKTAPEKFVEKEPGRPAGGVSGFILEVQRIGKELQLFELKSGENLVGRSSECDVCIDDASLSRRHAVLTVRSGKVTLKDLGSKNRTFVDKRAIEAEVEVGPEGKLQFGVVEAKLIPKRGG
jgi:pSer/pThr/pTyr-binding forkhead associated (FHA) protein